MSLEEALAANTAALVNLTAALSNSKPAATAAPIPEKSKRAEKPTPAAAPPPAEAAPTAAAAAAKQPTAKNVAEALISVVTGLSRDRGVEMLKKYGVKTASELKPEQYAEFVADCATTLAQAKAPQAPGADLLG